MSLVNTSKFPYIEVTGDHFEMGLSHGKQISGQIQEYIKWIRFKSKETIKQSQKRSMSFYNLINNFSNDYINEINGIAEGANIPFEDAMLCQVRFGKLDNTNDEGCTAFSFKGKSTVNSNLYIGQNQDMDPEFLNFGFILKLIPSINLPKIIMFTFPGQLGYAGMNEHGISNFANALYNFQTQNGIPHYILKRKLLEQKSLENCKKILNTINVSEAANVLISDKTNIIDFEFHNKTRYQYKSDDQDSVIHTNHYLTDELIKFEDNTLIDSPIRLQRMQYLIKNIYGNINLDNIKNILGDHFNFPSSICRHGADNMDTISGYIAAPENKTIYIRKGFGCEMNWQSYSFD